MATYSAIVQLDGGSRSKIVPLMIETPGNDPYGFEGERRAMATARRVAGRMGGFASAIGTPGNVWRPVKNDERSGQPQIGSGR